MDISSIENSLIDDRYKGMPGNVDPFELRRIADQRWNVLSESLPLPLAVLKHSAIAHNSRWMRRFLIISKVMLAPHGKTTMAPQLYKKQLADGAWGITLANISQIQIARRFGVSRILMANQLIGKQAIQYILSEQESDPEFEFISLVDSVQGVQQLASAARQRRSSRPLEVLVEGGVAEARCGCRTLDSALEVARQVKAVEPFLSLRGVEGFEGVIRGEDLDAREDDIRNYLQFLIEIAQECDKEKLFSKGPMILSAGGSGYFDLVADGFKAADFEKEVQIILRSGCYLTHDSQGYQKLHKRLQNRNPALSELGEGLLPALEVWSYVQSRPEDTRLILTMGRRDCSFDVDLPQPTYWYRADLHSVPQPLPPAHYISSLNDQHAMVNVPADSPLKVGDMIACGISHPCTTFDKWQLLPVVDDQYNVVEAVRTFF